MNTDFEEILKELKREYLQGLPQKMTRIDDLFQKLNRYPGDSESLNELFQLVHKIHGNAGSYDLDRLSVFASEWENHMEPWLEQKDPLTADQLGRLREFILFLHEMIRRILQNPSTAAF